MQRPRSIAFQRCTIDVPLGKTAILTRSRGACLCRAGRLQQNGCRRLYGCLILGRIPRELGTGGHLPAQTLRPDATARQVDVAGDSRRGRSGAAMTKKRGRKTVAKRAPKASETEDLFS